MYNILLDVKDILKKWKMSKIYLLFWWLRPRERRFEGAVLYVK